MISFKSVKTVTGHKAPSTGLNRKILVTGADNSLACFLAYGLADAGAQVSVQTVNSEAFVALKPKFPALQNSVADPLFAQMVATLAPDIILHASADAPRLSFSQTPMAVFNRIAEKTAVLCDIVRRESPKSRVVLLSSTDVYGEADSAKGEHDTLNPVSLNGRYFAVAEQILQDFAAYYDQKSTVLRVASAYGPAVRNNPVYELLFNLLGPQGTNVQFGYDPNATRDIIHAADVLQAVKLILKNPTDAAYNIATGHSLTLRELNTHLCAILEQPDMECVSAPTLREAAQQHFNVTKIAELGFIPEVPLLEGLRGYTAWWSGMKAA